jgi:hypothetical protein
MFLGLDGMRILFKNRSLVWNLEGVSAWPAASSWKVETRANISFGFSWVDFETGGACLSCLAVSVHLQPFSV